MTILLYILAAYGAFNLFCALCWWLYARSQRRSIAKPVEDPAGYQEHEGDPMFPGTDPNSQGLMKSYIAGQPAGMHAGQKSALEDSSNDKFTQTVDAIALRIRDDMEKANPKPLEPEVKQGGPMGPFLKWREECARIDALIENTVLDRMRSLDLRSEDDASAAFRELETGMRNA